MSKANDNTEPTDGQEYYEEVVEEVVEEVDEGPAAEEQKPKKKVSNVVIIGGVVAVLGLVAGSAIFLKGNSAPAPKKPAMALNAANPGATPTAPGSLDANKKPPVAPVAPVAPAAPAVGQDPTAQTPNGQNPLGANPLTVPGPANGTPTGQPAQPANPLDPIGAAQPVAVDPMAQPAQPAVPSTMGQPNLNGSPDPFNQAQPAPAQPTQMANDGMESSGMARGFDEIKAKLSEMFDSLKRLEALNIADRLQKLEDRMNAFERGGRPARVASTAKPAHDATHHRTQAAPKKSMAARVDGYLVYPADSEESKPVVGVLSTQERVAAKSSVPYSLQAVIPGRMWVKTSDGASLTYEVGETLPDGSRVVKIDPDKGRVQTSSGWLE